MLPSSSPSINPQAEIISFANSSPLSRKEFLSELSKRFYPSDWNHLHSLLEQRSFYMDILGTLPIELSFKVIQHLNPINTIRLRLVSKRYNEIFTSEDVCRFLSHNVLPAEATRPAEPASWKIYYENRVSRRQALLNGRPHSVEELEDSATMQMTSFCHKTSHFAYALDGHSMLQVTNLSTSPVTEVLPPMPLPNRGRIFLIQLLPTHVVVASGMGVCYAWNLETMEWHSFRLQNARVNSIHGDGNLVAIAAMKILVVHDVVEEKTKTYQGTYQGEPLEWLWNSSSTPDLLYHRLLVDAARQRIWTLTESITLNRRVVHMLDLQTGESELKEMNLEPITEGKIYNWELKDSLALYSGNDFYDFVFDFDVYSQMPCTDRKPRATRLVFDLRNGDCLEDTFLLDAPDGKRLPDNQFAHEYNGLTCCYNHHYAPVSSPGEVEISLASGDFFFPGMADRSRSAEGKEKARFRFLDRPDAENTDVDRVPWLCNAMTENFVLFISHWSSELPLLLRFKGIHEQ